MNQQIIEYLTKYKGQYSQEMLVQQLRNVGYGEDDIKQAVAHVFSGGVATQVAASVVAPPENVEKKGKFAMSWALVRASFGLLRQDKEIMLFPVVSSVVAVLVTITFFVPAGFFISSIFGAQVMENQPIVVYGTLFVYYLISYFIIAFFNSGLTACVMMRLQGGNPTFSYGMRVAMNHITQIFLWAVISATVGVLLRVVIEQLSQKFGVVGQIITRLMGGLLGFAWTLMTYFVVPVIIVENLSPKEAIKQSGNLFRKTWGENVIGNISQSLFFMAIIIPAFIVMLIGIFSVPTLTGVLLFGGVFLLLVIFLSVVSAAMNGIFTTVLYLYAKTGQVGAGFDNALIQQAFKAKLEKKGLFGKTQ